MTNAVKYFAAVGLLTALGVADGALAAPAKAQPAPAVAAVTLTQGPAVSRGVAGLPRISAPLTETTAKINTALGRADQRWRAFGAQCKTQTPSPDNEVSRKAEITLRGPSFLSVVIRYDYDCGGAYPDTGTMALVYDLDSGHPVNWALLLPKRLKATASLDSAADGSGIGAVASPVLHKLYLQAARAAAKGGDLGDCGTVLSDDGLQFMLWPDAAADGLALEPSSLPHVVKACADTQTIPTAVLRKQGVDARLLDAIDAAHAALRTH